MRSTEAIKCASSLTNMYSRLLNPFLSALLKSFSCLYCRLSVLLVYSQASKTWESSGDDWLSSKWSGFKSPRQLSRVRQTGVDVKVLRSIGERHRASYKRLQSWLGDESGVCSLL